MVRRRKRDEDFDESMWDGDDTEDDADDVNTEPAVVPDNLSSEDLDQLAEDLLGSSYSYFTEFVPSQLGYVTKHIETVNKRITKGRDAGDLQRLTASLRSLHQTYSELHERSTIVFMASYKPLMGLVESRRTKKAAEDAGNEEPESIVVDASDQLAQDDQTDLDDGGDWELDERQLSDLYRPYEDEKEADDGDDESE